GRLVVARHQVSDGNNQSEAFRSTRGTQERSRLTTSAAEEDLLRSYRLHANAYITKPVDFVQFADVVRRIDNFFFHVVRLPRHG
ncbi:hypothetical protein ACFWCF_25415, partial [Rhodococcus sp. NPDC060090]